MKKEKFLFNQLLRTYIKYKRRLRNLKLKNKNIRRQTILTNHIERLYNKLTRLRSSILTDFHKGITIGALSFSGVTFSALESNAQAYYAAPVINPFSLVDIGFNASPGLGDINNDGDLDLFTGVGTGAFRYFSNIGTVNAANFATGVVFNPFSLATVPSAYYLYPCFGDIDNDGDLDMFTQDVNGDFYYFQNNGTAAAPSFAPRVLNAFSLTSITNWGTISMVDIDNDGDLDIMSGGTSGNFHYFENVGTASAPSFGSVQNNPFGLADIGNYSSPTFADIDGDGDFDLISGKRTGEFVYFQNTGNASSPAFSPMQLNPFNLVDIGSNSRPFFADMDDDGDMDLLVGEYDGRYRYFQSIPPPAPTNTTAINDLSVCEGNATTLTISGLGNLSWYDAPTGGNFLGGGSTFITPALNSTTTYYAQDSLIAGPSTTRTAITVTVNAYPIADAPSNVTNCDSYILPSLSVGNYFTGSGGTGTPLFAGNSINSSQSLFVYAETGTVPNCIDENTFSITINLSTSSTVATNICSGASHTYADGTVSTNITADESHVSTLVGQNANSCDSVVTENLTVIALPIVSVVDLYLTMQSANCFGDTLILQASGADTYLWDDATTLDSNIYIYDDANQNMNFNVVGTNTTTGCSNTASIFIPNVYPEVLPSTDVKVACGSYTWIDGITYTSSNNTATFVVPSFNGCDSTINLDLTINNVDATASVNSLTITATSTTGSYQWIDCNNSNAIITGETGQSYTATANGSYAVIVTENGCTDTSACEVINTVGLNENNLNSDFKLYPNPNDGLFAIELNQASTIEISNAIGEIVLTKKVNTGKTNLDLSEVSTGVYFIKVTSNNHQNVQRIIINK